MQTHLLHTAAVALKTQSELWTTSTLEPHWNANQEHCICKHNIPLLSAASKAYTCVLGLLYSVFSVLQIQAWTVS